MPRDAQARLMGNLAAAMADVPEAIQHRQMAHFAKANPAYGVGGAARLGLATATATAAE